MHTDPDLVLSLGLRFPTSLGVLVSSWSFCTSSKEKENPSTYHTREVWRQGVGPLDVAIGINNEEFISMNDSMISILGAVEHKNHTQQKHPSRHSQLARRPPCKLSFKHTGMTTGTWVRVLLNKISLLNKIQV